MAEFELARRYLDEQSVESKAQLAARRYAQAEGLPALSPTLGSHLAFLAAATSATQIMQIGTTSGQAGCAFHCGAPEATVTSIDDDAERLDQERRSLLQAGHAPAWIRNISGDPRVVLPRMSESSYDLVLIASDLEHIAAHLQHALRVIRSGGSILTLNALNSGRVADPARRDPVTNSLRALIREFGRHPDLICSVLPLDGGVLQLTTPARR